MKCKLITTYMCIWILITMPTLIYAWVPIAGGIARVAVATKAGQVLAQKAGKFVKYAVNNNNISQGYLYALGYCEFLEFGTSFTENPTTCQDTVKKLKDAMKKDGWQTAETENGIEIYKGKECTYYCSYTDNNICFTEPRSLASHYFNEERRYRISVGEEISNFSYDYYKTGRVYYSYKYRSNSRAKWQQYNEVVHFVKEKPCKDKKQYLTEEDVWDMIQDDSSNISEKDIADIINYDYSDKSITINNITYNGDTIKQSFDPNNNITHLGDENSGQGFGLEIDPEFAPKLIPILVNPKIKLDLPDINYNNCTANAQGAIVSCDKLEKEHNIDINKDGKIGDEKPTCEKNYTFKDNKCVKIDKDQINKEDDPKKPKPTEKDDVQDPWVCNTSALTQKICNWIDWTKQEPAIPANDPIQPIDKTKDIELDKNILTFNKSCPAPQSFSFNMLGKTHSNQFDFKPFCDVATAIKPIILAVGGLVSIYILTGTPRPSDD